MFSLIANNLVRLKNSLTVQKAVIYFCLQWRISKWNILIIISAERYDLKMILNRASFVLQHFWAFFLITNNLVRLKNSLTVQKAIVYFCLPWTISKWNISVLMSSERYDLKMILNQTSSTLYSFGVFSLLSIS